MHHEIQIVKNYNTNYRIFLVHEAATHNKFVVLCENRAWLLEWHVKLT